MIKALSPIDDLRKNLALLEPQFKAALPSHIKPEKFARAAMTAIQLNPKLLDLDRTSLYASLLKAAQDGLIPDNREAALVPFSNKAVYMPMILGLCKRARNSGEILHIDAQVVKEDDSYESWTDEKGPHFKHRKASGDRGDAILTYAYASTKDGGFFFEEIDMEQMTAIEKMSRSKDSPWHGPFREEMMRKTALRRLCKYRLPSSADLDDLIRNDDEMHDVTSEKSESISSSRLAKLIDPEENQSEEFSDEKT